MGSQGGFKRPQVRFQRPQRGAPKCIRSISSGLRELQCVSGCLKDVSGHLREFQEVLRGLQGSRGYQGRFKGCQMAPMELEGASGGFKRYQEVSGLTES